jgi:hypothetical protein
MRHIVPRSVLLGVFSGEVTVSDRPFRDKRADRRRTTLSFFYLAALLSVPAISFVAKTPQATIRPSCHECWRGHLLLAPFPAYK